jgi:hypothetical protein
VADRTADSFPKDVTSLAFSVSNWVNSTHPSFSILRLRKLIAPQKSNSLFVAFFVNTHAEAAFFLSSFLPFFDVCESISHSSLFTAKGIIPHQNDRFVSLIVKTAKSKLTERGKLVQCFGVSVFRMGCCD